MSCTCRGCGEPYVVDLLVSDKLWERISQGDNLLCGACMMRRINALGEYGALFVYDSPIDALAKRNAELQEHLAAITESRNGSIRIIEEKRERIRELEKICEDRRQYELNGRAHAVWETNFQKKKDGRFSPWTESVLVDIHRAVIECDEEVGEDGLCRCMRYIGAIIQEKHDMLHALAEEDEDG